MKEHNESCKQGRKKAGPIRLNAAAAGGIERVVALGGALAVASIIAAFSMKKGGKKDNNRDRDKDKDTMNVAEPALAPAPAIELCAKEGDTGEGLSYIRDESSPTMHQNSCCTNNGTLNAGLLHEIETSELVLTESSITLEENTTESERKGHSVVIQQEETVVHDAAVRESDSMTGNHDDIQELSEPVHENENSFTDAVRNERLASLGMKFMEITIVDEAVHVNAEQPTPQPSSPSKEEENSSISTGEQEQQQQLEEEEEGKEEEEEYSLVQSSFPAVEEEEDSPKESSVSTDEEEEDSALQSSFSTEVEEDENGENAAELDEESSEGTWSSSREPNMEVIWPAEIMAFISSAPKAVDLSHLESEMKGIEDGKTPKGDPRHYSNRNRFDNNGEKNNRETGVMDVRKQPAAKRQTWFWFGLVVLVLALLANCLLQSNYLSNSISFVFPMK